jgi:hypothetical protein
MMGAPFYAIFCIFILAKIPFTVNAFSRFLDSRTGKGKAHRA